MHGQSSGLCDARVWTHVYLHNLWQANGRMPHLPAIRGESSAHFQGLKRLTLDGAVVGRVLFLLKRLKTEISTTGTENHQRSFHSFFFDPPNSILIIKKKCKTNLKIILAVHTVLSCLKSKVVVMQVSKRTRLLNFESHFSVFQCFFLQNDIDCAL